jgi:hypothetical protein
MRPPAFRACCWILLATSLLAAVEPRRQRTLMIAQYEGPGGNRILEVSSEGKLLWEHRVSGLCVMFQPLQNRHVVYACVYGDVQGIRA